MGKDNYKIFCKQLEDVIRKFPSLSIKEKDNTKYLKGILDISNEDSKIVGNYLIEIHFVDKFPFQFPMLFETGGSILNEADWHKYPDGRCCITVLPDEILKCKLGITVLEFVEKYCLSFFANHIHRKLTGTYLNGEYSHGITGIKGFYTDLFETDDFSKWENYYKHCFLMTTVRIGRNDKCFCGSNFKFKNCHYRIFASLYEIGPKQAFYDLKLISIQESFTSTIF